MATLTLALAWRVLFVLTTHKPAHGHGHGHGGKVEQNESWRELRHKGGCYCFGWAGAVYATLCSMGLLYEHMATIFMQLARPIKIKTIKMRAYHLPLTCLGDLAADRKVGIGIGDCNVLCVLHSHSHLHLQLQFQYIYIYTPLIL
jgi:hypothetical protein